MNINIGIIGILYYRYIMLPLSRYLPTYIIPIYNDYNN